MKCGSGKETTVRPAPARAGREWGGVIIETGK